ncbi:hypothetical protein Cgig2_032301 [Carnegiea gigantea]|uniref:Ubiquitin-like protease family profile domain-containing protein n=1 Tax=Carnegiea gigantea TaxID=171969 RepID=A0A9Q1Q7R5_9CARY|nr:hypothetical protein Cgig2_032301 [Carnegiea gigantea]
MKVMENSTHNMRKVQVFGTVLEDKGAPVACEGNCEQQNSLEARMNFIENLVVKVSSDIISLTSVVKENNDTLKMLNANVNRLMKHMVDNETSKSNKHMTDTCTTTYIAHPLKSSEKKESHMQFENADEMVADRRANIMKRQCLSTVVDSSTPGKTTMMSPKIQNPFAKGLEFDMGSKRKRRIAAEHNFSKDDMTSANELTKSTSVGGLNFLHEEDKKVNVNKSNSEGGLDIMQQAKLELKLNEIIDLVACELTIEARMKRVNRVYLPTCFQVYIPMNDRAVHWFLIVVDLERRCVALLDSLPLNKSNDFRRELAKDLDMEVERLRKIVDLQMSVNNHIKKTNGVTENSTVNITIVDTLWDKNADLSEDDSSLENSLNMFGKVIDMVAGELMLESRKRHLNRIYLPTYFQDIQAERLRKLVALWNSDNNVFRNWN